jgi:hypothetical protein
LSFDNGAGRVALIAAIASSIVCLELGGCFVSAPEDAVLEFADDLGTSRLTLEEDNADVFLVWFDGALFALEFEVVNTTRLAIVQCYNCSALLLYDASYCV